MIVSSRHPKILGKTGKESTEFSGSKYENKKPDRGLFKTLSFKSFLNRVYEQSVEK